MNANLPFSGVTPVYRSRSLREGYASSRGLDADTASAEEPREVTQSLDADLAGVERCPLTRLHLAVAELFNAVSSALQEEWDMAQECVQRASAILKLEPFLPHACAPISGQSKGSTIRIRGGLAPWQIRQVATYIESHLDTTIRTKDLAALVRLSSFHFCRAFRESFNDSPHGYLMRRRVERAQGLMLTTSAPLGQIAAECGLADQAHFNKLFRRFVGDSPGAWRRARATAPVQI
jgi:AraC family transcriptional regulator